MSPDPGPARTVINATVRAEIFLSAMSTIRQSGDTTEFLPDTEGLRQLIRDQIRKASVTGPQAAQQVGQIVRQARQAVVAAEIVRSQPNTVVSDFTLPIDPTLERGAGQYRYRAVVQFYDANGDPYFSTIEIIDSPVTLSDYDIRQRAIQMATAGEQPDSLPSSMRDDGTLYTNEAFVVSAGRR